MINKNFITSFGLFSTVVVSIVGIGIFAYPSELATVVGNDGWIVTLLVGFIAYALAYLIYKVVKINNFNKFLNLMENNFGKIFGGILSIIFVAYTTFSMAIGMRSFVEVIKMYLLEKTPTEFLIVVTIITGSYLIRGEIDNLVKFNEIAFGIMFLPIGLVLLLTLNHLDFTNIFPVFNNQPINYLKGMNTAVFTFTGFELMYLFLPFVRNKAGIKKCILRSIGFVTAFYTVIVIFCIAIFSKAQTETLLWPTITMIKSINIHGAFIERWEGIVMAMWIIFYFTTFINYYYFSADIVKDVFRLKDVKLSILIIVPFIYAIAMYPQNIAELYEMGKTGTHAFALYVLIALPLVLLLINKVRSNQQRGGEQNET
ncbi:GerAB/ArcD/ProY family transporter [Clostridium scatologenes]|uniref:Spore germination protein n=1 Tax=Clostridium scatologenes TaxID=1548 RepID=A0A0E3GRX3_CLOSL|nr:endospore germination permease [Clostridium scatologenes]AKA71071.1 spore germination protein [Clostridium scatologenes]